MFMLAMLMFALGGHPAPLTGASWLVDDNYRAGHDMFGNELAHGEPVAATEESPYLDPGELRPLTLDELFEGRSLTSEERDRLDPSKLHTVVATGDVIPARYVNVVIQQQGDDFLYPVEEIVDLTRDADLTFVNLEAPLIEGCPFTSEGFTFCGRPAFVESLEALGTDVVTLENNHIGNYGRAAIEETQGHLEEADIAWADRTTPATQEIDGVRFGFLAFNGVGESVDVDAMQQEIEQLRPDVDVLITAFHWGGEYTRVPTTAGGVAEQDPRELARAAIDAGADLVQGNHPHWPQAVELYDGKLISYALGNTIFDQMWSLETRQGLIATYTFYGDKLLNVEFAPVLIENYARPEPMEHGAAAALLGDVRDASEQLVDD